VISIAYLAPCPDLINDPFYRAQAPPGPL
jgi:hypothetical protein